LDYGLQTEKCLMSSVSPNGHSQPVPPVNVHTGTVDPSRQHTVIFQPSGRRGKVPEGTSLLEAARSLGVGVESICGGRQTCSKCYVRVETGSFTKYGIETSLAHLTPPGERELYYRQKRGLPESMRYSCDARILGDVLVSVPAESRAQKQLIRKNATERYIDVEPAVRQYYVEIPEPDPQAIVADAQRVISELVTRFPELGTLAFDYAALRDLQVALRDGKWAISLSIWNDRDIIRVQPGYHDRTAGLAIDVGSTSMVAYLCDLRTGHLLATASMMNPQVTYGDDLMSRISYATEETGGLARLHGAVIEGLNDLARDAAAQAGLRATDIVDMVIVANSVMHHFILNLQPKYLGLAPFVPATYDAIDIPARELALDAVNPGARAHFLPLEAGFVGADNVGVILAESPHKHDEIVLVVDVGTNGEILLGNRERLLCASSPSGPALEGAQILHGMRAAPGAIERVRIDPVTLNARFKVIGRDVWSDELPSEEGKALGICGSGIIEAVVELWRAGIIDNSGKWNKTLEHPRLVRHDDIPAYVLAWPEQTSLGQAVLVSLADVRAIQLAKAALYTGVRVLMRYCQVEKIDRIVLTGAFGSYIDPEYAMTLGMIPECDLNNVTVVGNAAGDGARIALLNKTRRKEASNVARWVEHVTMPYETDFQDMFLNALQFPDQGDSIKKR
jgi:uncharacterized 2Fe-2S/4Fe-4S cluster protein (DUF4445 family)